MHDLREQLRQILQGRVCLVGVGNVAWGDDGIGVRLAEMAAELSFTHSALRVMVAGSRPEHYLTELSSGDFDNILFLDAVEFGAEPGAVVLLDSSEMAARFPQISTHKLSLGLLAKVVEASCETKAWLLGVQPESLKEGTTLTPKVQASLHLLADLLTDAVRIPHAARRTPQSALAC